MIRQSFIICVLLAAVLDLARSQPYGIDSRVENTTLLISAEPDADPESNDLVRVFPQLSFVNPLLLVEAPDGSERLFVIERDGRIRVFPKEADPAPGEVSTFLDIRSRVQTEDEQGLLGLAFDPDYASNGRVYVCYSYDDGASPGPTRISRFTNNNPADNSLEQATEEILLSVNQTEGIHKGGMIAFGPDGYFYISLGDGGPGNDPNNNAQNTTVLLGKILRIDVTSTPPAGETYAIPPSNPFAGGAGGNKEEIFAWGFRNPWRWSFDQFTGTLYCADVGQSKREEISIVENGKNYGWKIAEGFGCRSGTSGCDLTGLEPPIIDYDRTQGQAIIGGFVYRDTVVAPLEGKYIYGDYSTRRIWGLRYDGNAVDGPDTLVASSPFTFAAFGQDLSGEVYILEFTATGGVYVLRPSGGGGGDFPPTLSEIAALLEAGKGIDQTDEGIIPYQPAAELWSDGALKERFIALPGLEQATFAQADGWDFPEETVLIKNFSLPLDDRDPVASAKRIETRLLYRKDGQWRGYSYEWNQDETDAVLLPGQKDRSFTRIDSDGNSYSYTWSYPSRQQCNQCHTIAANGVLGLTTPQLNSTFEYPDSGVTDNQLRTLDHIDFFTSPLPDPPGELPQMPNPFDETESLQDRARAYLAANCAQCHRPDGTAGSEMNLTWEISNNGMQAINRSPTFGNLGISGARIIKAGFPEQSILYLRMQSLETERMPPLATSKVDEAGAELIRQWILSLAPPPPPPSSRARNWERYE